MSQAPNNPFVFPGLGSSNEQLAGNPVLQGLEMMRQAWSGTQNLLSAMPATPAVLDPDELERRINDLRAVEHWLKLNLSMLQSSIQAMDVQRTTLTTLRAFASGTPGAMPSAAAMAAVATQAAQAAQAAPAAAAAAAERVGEAALDPAQAMAGLLPESALQAQQAWWNMLQSQFSQIASAATASLQPAEGAAEPAAAASAAADAAPAAKTARRAPARKTPAARKRTS